MIIRAIKKAYDYAELKKFDTLYFFFDIHGTIIKPNYKYGDIPTEFYPNAKETLQYISKLQDIVMILYTCSHPEEIEKYLELFKNNNIHFKYVNENPEVRTEGYGCYDKKPYMSVLFEDKSSFEPEVEWLEVLAFMKHKYNN